MPARIEDVARTAGVSMKTVSRVFNNEPNVRERMRARVEAAAKELNYRPNPSARSLAGNRSYLISLVYDDPAAGSSYIMEIIVGMLAACESSRYSAMLRPLDYANPGHIAAVEDAIAQYRLDGLILVPPFADDIALLKRLDELGVRYATISAKANIGHERIGTILDERKAAAQMIDHVVALGHRRIGHVAGPLPHGGRAWRLAGYRDGLRRAGIPVDEDLIAEGGFSFENLFYSAPVGAFTAKSIVPPQKRPRVSHLPSLKRLPVRSRSGSSRRVVAPVCGSNSARPRRSVTARPGASARSATAEIVSSKAHCVCAPVASESR